MNPRSVFEYVELTTYRPIGHLQIWDDGGPQVTFATLDGFHLGQATRDEVARAWWAWERGHA